MRGEIAGNCTPRIHACKTDEGLRDVEPLEFDQQLCVIGHLLRSLGHLHEQVEVVAHDAVGDHAHFAEFLVEPHEPDELLLFLGFEDEFAVLDTGHAMVVCQGMMGRGFETGFSHEKRFGNADFGNIKFVMSGIL